MSHLQNESLQYKNLIVGLELHRKQKTQQSVSEITILVSADYRANTTGQRYHSHETSLRKSILLCADYTTNKNSQPGGIESTGCL